MLGFFDLTKSDLSNLFTFTRKDHQSFLHRTCPPLHNAAFTLPLYLLCDPLSASLDLSWDQFQWFKKKIYKFIE